MRDHTTEYYRIGVDVLLSAVFWDAQNCGHQKIDGGIMTHPKLLYY